MKTTRELEMISILKKKKIKKSKDKNKFFDFTVSAFKSQRVSWR